MVDLQSKGPSRLTALESLSELLSFADESLLSAFPFSDMGMLLTTILDTKVKDQILELDLQCISTLLSVHFASLVVFSKLNLLQKIFLKFADMTSFVAIEHCYQIFSIYAQEDPKELYQHLTLKPYFLYIPSISKITQRSATLTLSRIASLGVHPDYATYIPEIMELMLSDDVQIRKNSISLFNTITTNLPPSLISEKIYRLMCTNLNECNDFIIVSSIVSALYRLSRDKQVALCMAAQPLDFKHLLFDFESNEYIQTVFDLIIFILPQPKLPRIIWTLKNHKIDFVKEKHIPFVKNVEPILFRYIKEKKYCIEACLKALVCCTSFVPFESTATLFSNLVRLARIPSNTPYVLAMVYNLQDKSHIVRSGLLSVFQTLRLPKPYSEWYQEHVSTLAAKCQEIPSTQIQMFNYSPTLDDILNVLKDGNIYPYEFYTNSLMEMSTNLIRLPNAEQRNLSNLLKMAYGILDFLQFPQSFDPYLEISKLRRKKVTLVLSGPKLQPANYSVTMASDLTALEGWYNLKINPKADQKLRETIQDNIPLISMLELDLAENTKSYERFALLNRAFQTDGYIRCSFKIGKYTFSAFDNITYALSRVCQTPGLINQIHFDVKVIEEEEERSSFNVSPFVNPNYTSILGFFNIFHQKFSDQFYIDNLFAHNIVSLLSNPLETLTLNAPAVQFMFQFPYMFSFEDRLFLFKVLALDTNMAIKLIQHRFYPGLEDAKIRFNHIRCQVPRDGLFEQGCFILSRFGAGRIRTDFIFEDEVAFGEGPTQEFFTLMSHSFCAKDLRIWLDESNSGEHAFHKMGLYPSPDADNGILEVLGLFCSKAILMEKIIEIPFNPAFFKIILGKKVEIEEIDPQLAKSLNYPDGLYDLPFLFPGTLLELKPGGSEIIVDSSNVSEYIFLVKDFLAGDFMRSKVKRFLKSFSTNLYYSTLQLFSPDEIVKVITGEDVKITDDDLKNYVNLEHGYDSNSKEIQDLFSIILEMTSDEKSLFVRFVTGCNKLPIGGLAALQPHLTIAKRVIEASAHPDDCLPSVMTCTNYFKMPQYSSRIIMKQKIIQAITECQNSFQFS